MNKLFYIEDCLPFLIFNHLLNKHQVVTQNYKKNPAMLNMNSLNILSEPKVDFAHKSTERESADLWNLLTSCNIRQKQFKDYFLSAFPVTYFYKSSSFHSYSKFNFSLEFNFNNKKHDFFNSPSSEKSENQCEFSIFNISIELKSIEQLYDSLKSEWFSICQIFKLLKELNEAMVKYPDVSILNYLKFRVLNDFNIFF